MKPSKGNHRRHRPAPARHKLCSAVLLAMFACTAPAWAQRNDAPQAYSITAGDLASALDQLASQSKVQIIYPAELVRGKRAAAVNGQQTWRDVLQALLAGTGLTYGFVNDTTVVIRAAESSTDVPATAPNARRSKSTAENTEPVHNMAEILVKGSRSLNADIRRTMNDPQPYVVFEREDIERSGATNLNDFMLTRVSANTSSAPGNQAGLAMGDTSGVNLRGLGQNQTLILIDGRRGAPTYAGGGGQVNLNGIPLAAVERIEVLPTTASAIYGGSATGGVVNVILRRDYQGGEVSLSHDDSFDTDSSITRIDFSYGAGVGERTSLMLSGSYSETNFLLKRDRDFRSRGIERIYQNDPSFLSTFNLQSTSPNIFSQTGADLRLLDGTQLGSPFTHAPEGYMGPGSDDGASLITNAGRVNQEYNNGAGGFGSGGASVFVVPRYKSLSASIRHQVSDRMEGFLDLFASENASKSRTGTLVTFALPAGHRFNPFQQAVRVVVPSEEFNVLDYQRNEIKRASAGLIARLGEDWAGSMDLTYYRSSGSLTRGAPSINYSAALADDYNPLVDYYNTGGRSLLPYMISDGRQLSSTKVESFNPTMRFSGPLWSLPAGPASASFLLEQQRMKFSPFTRVANQGFPNESSTFFPGRSQDVKSVYAELTMPIFGNANRRAGLHSLDLQVAVRHDDYATVTGGFVTRTPAQGQGQPEFEMVENSAGKTTGLIGLKYAPVSGLTIRASHGTGFVPPDISQLGASSVNESQVGTLVDPRRGGTIWSEPWIAVSGANPDLRPEHSRTTSFGLVVEPERMPGFRASVDYTRLRKTDNIVLLSSALLLEYEESFPDRVRRGPNLPTDAPGWAGPITYLDTSRINAASSGYKALDAHVKYGFDLSSNTYIELLGSGTWVLEADQQTVPGGPTNNLRGIADRVFTQIPLGYRGSYGVNVERRSWEAGWTARHYGSYLVADPDLASSARLISAQGNGGRVPRQIIHDLWWRITDAPSGPNWLRDLLVTTEISGGVRNIFNKKPEVDLSNDYQFHSYLVDPRLRTYYIQIKYAF